MGWVCGNCEGGDKDGGDKGEGGQEERSSEDDSEACLFSGLSQDAYKEWQQRGCQNLCSRGCVIMEAAAIEPYRAL